MSTMERILRLMAERKASDIYLSAHSPALIRINGNCLPINAQVLPPEAPLGLLAEVVHQSRIAELERTGELNMAIQLEGAGNFRISAMRQRGSYAVVVRHIALTIPSFDDLHLPDILKTLIMERRGLILMVGATGVGKSTTLASMLDYRNENASGHILTVEEPIEFTYTNKKSMVNQRDVGSDTQSLQVALKNALRQAPDVIQIGEIRDRETMDHAIAFAETGHLCLATLHANSANQALDRIINFFPEERRQQLLMDLSLNLKGMISQRLIPRKEAKGRAVAIEIMLNSPLISDLIFKGQVHEIKELMKKSRELGMQTFDQSLFDLHEADIITYEDALRNADSVNDLRLAIKLEGKAAKNRDLSAGTEHLGII